MQHDTTNLHCAHRRSISHGGRRRKCLACGATWTARPKKRGRKPGKRRLAALAKTFVQRLTLVQQARRSSTNADVFSKRHAASLAALAERPWPHAIPEGRLILVMDAIWFRQGDGRQTVYLLGLRKTDDDALHFLRPVLRPGHESRKRWREVIDGIPAEAKRRVSAVVSDSFSGAGGIARTHGWVFQRCQAHLLLRLEALCGDYKRAVSWRAGRQELKRLAYALMNARSRAKASKIADAFARLGDHPHCPRILRYIVGDALRHLHEYRACYLHPELRLPATTNAIENTNGRIRSVLNRSRGCRTPASLIRWITGFLWFNPTVACRPKSPTEIRR